MSWEVYLHVNDSVGTQPWAVRRLEPNAQLERSALNDEAVPAFGWAGEFLDLPIRNKYPVAWNQSVWVLAPGSQWGVRGMLPKDTIVVKPVIERNSTKILA